MKLVRMIDDYVTDKQFSIIYKNNTLNIINYSEIKDFTSSLISVRHKEEVYHIEGKDLVISKMMDNEILITGNISQVTFK